MYHQKHSSPAAVVGLLTIVSKTFNIIDNIDALMFNGFSGFPVWLAALVVSVFGFGLFPALEWFAFGSPLLGHLGLWPKKKSRNFGVKPVGPVKHVTPIKETSTSVVHKQLGKEGLCEDTDSPSVSQTLGELDTSSESSADEPQSIVVKDKNGSNSVRRKSQTRPINFFLFHRHRRRGSDRKLPTRSIAPWIHFLLRNVKYV
ncbi:Hypothetical predicted protein [Olea europaea subsp. europaea]|uniref:Uncharacterized protein n=1 Tax=Olea europaea subsp. europaea TaxID=158383 RepID=A0A8S0RQ66_OLEEU|nr:Hypothetical predicted protein [Olea europaea subsp. europaea]